jgi:hypothetical protein
VKVRMTERIEGQWHDGEQWQDYPAIGETMETDAVTGEHLIARGSAEPVTAKAAKAAEDPKT